MQRTLPTGFDTRLLRCVQGCPVKLQRRMLHALPSTHLKSGPQQLMISSGTISAVLAYLRSRNISSKLTDKHDIWSGYGLNPERHYALIISPPSHPRRASLCR